MFQSEAAEEANEIIDFETGNEYTSTFNRDVFNAQIRANNLNYQPNNDLNSHYIENRYSYPNPPNLELICKSGRSFLAQGNGGGPRSFVSQN